MVQRYIWVAHLLIIAVAAALAANITTSYLRAKLGKPEIFEPEQDTSTPQQRSRQSITDYAVINERNIFNANPPSKTPPFPPKRHKPRPIVTVKIEDTQLQLKLIGTVVSRDSQSYAFIEDLRRRGSQGRYQVGDSIQNTLISEILAKCVVFDKQGRHERLCFPDVQNNGTTNGTASHTTTAIPAETVVSDEGIIQVDDGTWQVSRELMQENFNNLGSLATQARVTPYIVQGQTQGFRLSRLKHNGLLQKIGLVHGDVLQKVNGLGLNSPADALQAYQQLQQAGTVRLEIIRRNSPTTLTYVIR